MISNSAKLDYQLGFMVVRGTETVKIHIDEIEMIIIENTAVALTAYLLSALVKKKVKVVFCDEKRNPCSELLPYYGSHDTSAKIRYQMEWSSDIKAAVWTEIVSEKIRMQSRILKRFNHNEFNMLIQYVEEMTFGDQTNREGHAAKVYFNSLFGKNFTRTEECPINSALNYGYSIILSCFNRAIVANGYITQIGLFHGNMFNEYNLASDLMEPFRVLVDEQVKGMPLEKFETEEKHLLLNVLKREVFINGHNEILTNAIKIYVRSVFDALNDKDVSLIKFYEL